MAKISEKDLAELIFRQCLHNVDISDLGAQWYMAENEISVTIGPITEGEGQVNPQRFVIKITED